MAKHEANNLDEGAISCTQTALFAGATSQNDTVSLASCGSRNRARLEFVDSTRSAQSSLVKRRAYVKFNWRF